MINFIKDIIIRESDEMFFDKQATIKEYFAVCPKEQRRHVDTYEELYQEALQFVGKQNFSENTKDQENYFRELGADDIGFSIIIGICAYRFAKYIDSKGEKWEKKLDTLPKTKDEYDKYSPFDGKVGKDHRYFGHDIATFWDKNIPNQYEIKVGKDGSEFVYKTVGELTGKDDKVSMFELIWAFYGKDNKLKGIMNCMQHTLFHFAKDLLTAEGVPLPLSGLFTKFKIEDFNLDDMKAVAFQCEKSMCRRKLIKHANLVDTIQKNNRKVTNKFNDLIKKVNGNMKASDFAALSFIEEACNLWEKKGNNKIDKSHKRDLKIISMGMCVTLQSYTLLYAKDKRGVIDGAKLNVIMTGVLFKNMTQELVTLTKIRLEVNKAYSRPYQKCEDG